MKSNPVIAYYLNESTAGLFQILLTFLKMKFNYLLCRNSLYLQI